MKKGICLIALLLVFIAQPAAAERRAIDPGQREYLNSCAACHGIDGKGQTQALDILRVAPPNLRLLAKNNGGVFPMARVYETIDGRATVASHGSRDMPIWGQRFSVEGAPTVDDYPYNAEAFIRARILSLIEYIYRMQDK